MASQSVLRKVVQTKKKSKNRRDRWTIWVYCWGLNEPARHGFRCFPFWASLSLREVTPWSDPHLAHRGSTSWWRLVACFSSIFTKGISDGQVVMVSRKSSAWKCIRPTSKHRFAWILSCILGRRTVWRKKQTCDCIPCHSFVSFSKTSYILTHFSPVCILSCLSRSCLRANAWAQLKTMNVGRGMIVSESAQTLSENSNLIRQMLTIHTCAFCLVKRWKSKPSRRG